MKICKHILKIIILHIIQFIEFIEYFHLKLDESDNSKKILNSIPIDLPVLTDDGQQRASSIHITQPYQIWELKTTEFSLKCADNHIVFDKNMNEVFVKNLRVGDKIRTKNGLQTITAISKKRNKVSMFDLTIDSPNHRYYTSSILSHNTITSSFFINWFMCFHYDKNCLIVANKGGTVKEIINKIKQVYENLPFFLKPGVNQNNVLSMWFDNGSRFIGQNTSKTPGLGFTIHLLYADEFAHIPANIIDSFYRSIFPTMSSSKTSRIIITSTAKGMNKFYEIYKSAVNGENDYKPIRIDWDAVPGRDDEWRQKEIANIGSEEDFKQEYENQFFADSQMAFDRWTQKKLARIKTNYVWQPIRELDDAEVQYKNLIWHPNFSEFDFSNTDKFLISVDIASGGGKDYSVINIFKVETASIAKMRTRRKLKDEGDFFRITQIGVFRDNKISIDDLSGLLSALVFDFLGAENTRIILEMNHKGEMIENGLSQHVEYFDEIFIHTKHSISADELKIGVKLNKANKPLFCSEMAHLVKNNKIVITENQTIVEALNFGIDANGNYKSQLGNDDIIMTVVNSVVYFKSADFYETIEEIIDNIEPEKRNTIYNRLDNVESTEYEIDYTYIGNNI